jgi:hypothetical protein
MIIALSTSNNRIAPGFAGVELLIFDTSAATGADAPLPTPVVVDTTSWHPLDWGRELARHNVKLLICSGINHSTWATLKGHNIEVIPNAIGSIATAYAQWLAGSLTPPPDWAAYPCGQGHGCGQGRGMGRGRGGGGRGGRRGPGGGGRGFGRGAGGNGCDTF